MYEQFGFSNKRGAHGGFAVFIPDREVDPSQYDRGGPCNIAEIRVAGDFTGRLPGGNAWDLASALVMHRLPHANGRLYVADLPAKLPAGLYEYKFAVRFTGGAVRWVSDPCAKLGGRADGNSAFVIGGPPLTAVPPLAHPRAPADLVIYELMIDDFTRGYRGNRAPIDAVVDKLPYLASLGINAIEFMPWTATPDDPAVPFSWCYDPAHFFSVEQRYVDDGSASPSRVRRLQDLIRACHAHGLAVIMDVVLQHAKCDPTDIGFGYYGLWEDPSDCPFIGDFTGAPTYGSRPLAYANRCAGEFAADVCWYWLQRFGVDGLRVDQTSGFYRTGDAADGLPAVIAAVRAHTLAAGRGAAPWFLEDSWGYDAIDRTNFAGADGCWLDPFRTAVTDGLAAPAGVGPAALRALDSARDFAPTAQPVIYLENHDHSGVAWQAGGRSRWFRTQPAAIALFTSPGALLLRNGQEFGWDVMLWEDDSAAPAEFKRVQPRSVPWPLADDAIGVGLRALYARLATLRAAHPALRDGGFYPSGWDQGRTSLDDQGYGIDAARQLVVYHRWGADAAGTIRYYTIALNFAGDDRWLDLPFSNDGAWTELLGGNTVNVSGYRIANYRLPSNWGVIYCQ